MSGTFVITEWDGTEEVVDVLEGPVPELEMGADDVRIRYQDGVVHEVKRSYFLNDLQAALVH